MALTTDKIKKLVILAKRGVGGEKDNAVSILKRNGINPDDYNDEGIKQTKKSSNSEWTFKGSTHFANRDFEEFMRAAEEMRKEYGHDRTNYEKETFGDWADLGSMFGKSRQSSFIHEYNILVRGPEEIILVRASKVIAASVWGTVLEFKYNPETSVCYFKIKSKLPNDRVYSIIKTILKI